MSRWMHGLTEIDVKNKAAICSICGPTSIYFRPDDYAVCLGWNDKLEKERYARSQRRLVVEAMGRECVFCGFDDWRALHIDHKIGTGGKRKSVHKIYAEILLGQTDEYQLLCANCNAIKRSKHIEHSGFYKSVMYKR